MAGFLLKTIHEATFPRYAPATSEEDTKEGYLVSAAEELLRAYHSFWYEEVGAMVREAKEKHAALPFKVEGIYLEAPTAPPASQEEAADYCRQYRETLEAQLRVDLVLAPEAREALMAENDSFHFGNAAEGILRLKVDMPYLSPQGTFIFLGNDYVYINQLTRQKEVAKEDPRPVNSLETKYVHTLYLLLKKGVQGFLDSFYVANKQNKWLQNFQKGRNIDFSLNKLLQKLNFKGSIKRRSELLQPRNPLEELSAHNTIKSTANQRASFAYRDISYTQYGKLCPIETPEGKQAGLVQHLAAYAKIDGQGQIITPYYEMSRKGKQAMGTLAEEKPVYYSAVQEKAEESRLYLCSYAKDGSLFPYRRHGHKFIKKSPYLAHTHRDLCKGQILSHATALIPFLEHDDGHRALMAAGMQKQALTLCKPEPPIVGTGREHFVANSALLCRDSIVQEELALGTNILVAYLPWEGYTHEDAIVISQELVDKDILTSQHTYTYEVQLEEGERLYPDKLVQPGTLLNQGALLVGKEKGYGAGDNPTSLFQALIYKDTSLYFTDFPYAEKAKVEKVLLLDEYHHQPKTLEEAKSIRITISYQSKIKVGDKLAGRHGNKGVVSLILPQEQMPYYLSDKGQRVYAQMIMDPLSIPSRMNLGQLYEAHLGRLALRLGQLAYQDKLGTGSSFAGFVEGGRPSLLWQGSNLGPAVPFAMPPFSSLSLEELQQLYVAAGMDPSCKETVYYTHYDKDRSDRVKKPLPQGEEQEAAPLQPEQEAAQKLMNYTNKATVGVTYILKLDHQVEETINVRSTGKYTKIFQQPTRGRALKGGQRLGEMEFWALEAYGAKENIEECLTYKADDLVGRAEMLQKLREGETSFKPQAHVPYALTVLQQFLHAMALKLELRSADSQEDKADSVTEGKSELQEASQSKQTIRSQDITEARLRLLTPTEIQELTERKDQPFRLIKLAVPVVHPLFYRQLAKALKLKNKELLEVMYYRQYLCAKMNKPGKFAVISLEDYLNKTYAETLQPLGTGAVALQQALQSLPTAEGLQPEQLLLTALPKLPEHLLPEDKPSEYRLIMDPLNEAYARLERQNALVEKLLKQEANEAFLNLDKCKLQAYVDGLICAGDYSLLEDVKYYKNLLNKINTKKGILRANLLGKRVDYSGRSVIISDPSLKMDQCGISTAMALELFKPFLHKYKEEKAKLEALKQLIKDKVVLLGRNPALHRLSIQAFYIKLEKDLCIHLHPLVCAGFNADFDGDSMFLLLPLSEAAQQEAKEKMLATNNLLSPGTGKPMATLTQEMVLGIYRDTFVAPREQEAIETIPYESVEAAKESLKKERVKDTIYSYRNRRISVQVDNLEVYGDKEPEDDMPVENTGRKKAKDKADTFLVKNTSIGLVNFNRYVIPYAFKKQRRFEAQETKHGEVIFDGYDKQALEELISNFYLPEREDAIEVATELLNNLMYYGFTKASTYGISFAMSDFPRKLEPGQELSQALGKEPFNPLTIIYNSGARGKEHQWNQLRGKRGEFVELDKKKKPINTMMVESDFYDGVTDLEFFVACHGTRKGVTDTALATADSGSLARQLVLALQEVRITEEDCCASTTAGAVPGLDITTLVPAFEGESEEAYLVRQQDFVKGRYLAEAYPFEADQKQLEINTCLTGESLERLTTTRLKGMRLRSPITCKAQRGICAKCYGLSPMTRKPIEVGTHVGIIAAHSLSEPTTQFTLDSKHGTDNAKQAATGKTPIEELRALFKASQEELKERFDNKDGQYPDFREHYEIVRYLLEQILKVYKDNKAFVRTKHVEVLLSQMLTFDNDSCVELKGISKLLKQKPFLTQLGAGNPAKIIIEAVENCLVDDFSTINSRVLVGKTLN